jgi:hypothetical protein
MTKLFPIIVVLGLAVAFTPPAAAGAGLNTAPPTTKSTCEKAKMYWNDQQQRCCTTSTIKGRCM